jgi:hypothetical protein
MLDHLAPLEQGWRHGRTHPDERKLFAGDHRHKLDPGPLAVLTHFLRHLVNVVVNENPAEPCLCLLCQMPSDQHHDRACALLHTGSND